MGRVGNCLLTTFRVCQFLFSLVALGCGAYITYEMYDLADLAHDLELALNIALSDAPKSKFGTSINDALKTLSKALVPVLQYLQETPTRAIVLTVVSFVSIVIIIYMFWARRSKKHSAADRQSIRVTLEITILLAWVGGFICAALLALQYGTLALSGGLAIKGAMITARKVLENILENQVKSVVKQNPGGKDILDALDLFGDLTTIALMAIVSTLAAAICLNASFISTIVACCSKSRKKQPDYEQHGVPTDIQQPLTQTYEDKTPKPTHVERKATYITRKPLPPIRDRPSPVSYMSEPTAPWEHPRAYQPPSQNRYQPPPSKTYQPLQSTQSWDPPQSQGWQPVNSQKWHPPEDAMSAPIPYTASTPYTGKPTPYMAFTSSEQEPYHYSVNDQYHGGQMTGGNRWAR